MIFIISLELNMKIVIKKIRTVNSNVIVDFLTDYGAATAIWDGGTPAENCEYHVEVDLEDTLTWGKDIVISETNRYSIQMYNKNILLVGILDSIEDDGYAIVRIGESVVPFITKGLPFEVGSFVKLISKTVILTPIYYF